MRLKQRNFRTLLITAGILAPVICQAQEKSAKPNVDALLRQLHHVQWTDRAEAYEKLSSDSKALTDHRVQEELLNLLGRESGYIPMKAGDPAPDDIPNEQGEAFAEYVGYLAVQSSPSPIGTIRVKSAFSFIKVMIQNRALRPR
jgi:hypothetical protein